MQILSSQQHAVAARVALGESNKQIAKSLGISPNTVRTHMNIILEKLGCSNRTQVAIKVRDGN